MARRLKEMPRRRRVWYGIVLVGVVAVVIFALDAVYGFVGGASSSTGAQRTVTVARGTVQSSVHGVGERECRAIRGGELFDERDRHLGAHQGRRSRDRGAEARDPGLRFGRGRPRDRQGEPRTGGGDACRGAGRCDRRATGIERFEPPLGAGSGDVCRAAVGSRQEGARDGAATVGRQQEARLSAHVELVYRIGFVVAVELRVE